LLARLRRRFTRSFSSSCRSGRSVWPGAALQRALLEHLSREPRRELDQAASGIARVETEAAVNRLSERNLRDSRRCAALLKKRGLFVAWRGAVDGFFQTIDPVLEPQLYPDAPRRLVVQIYGSGIEIQREKVWNRFKAQALAYR